MKRVGYLYQSLLDKDLISACWDKAIKGKKKRYDVSPLDKDTCVEAIYEMLVNRTYVPATPRKKTIYDTSSRKEREISIVPFFPDGVIQNVMVTLLQPILLKNMYPWSCASLPNRGGNCAQKKIKSLLKDEKNTQYCLKLDIHHFYPTIDHDLMMAKLERRIKDKEFLALTRRILDTADTGLPIGFYLSQWLSNFYLENLDWKIAHSDGVFGYVRYMDDMVILGSNKAKLHEVRKSIQEWLGEEKLELKGNYTVFPVDSRSIDFVGYRFYHGYTKMRRKNSLRLMKQCRKIKKGDRRLFTAKSFLSRMGIVQHCDSYKFQQKYFDFDAIHELKEVERNESKRQREAADIHSGNESTK